MRELCKALSELEESLVAMYGVSLYEAMVMCCIGSERMAAGDIAHATGFKNSHLSKVLRALEEKALITRALGDKDKRQFYFTLTPNAVARLHALKCDGLPIPDVLKAFFD